MTTHHADVAIIGAGPVGMSCAIEASLRGHRVVVIEQRERGEPPSAKCNTVAARSMETFRRFGIADKVRDAGLPNGYATDTVYCTSITGYELARLRLPARNERGGSGFLDDGWPTPEPMVRVSQLYLEPIMFERLLGLDSAIVLNSTAFQSFEQDEDGVAVHARDASGEVTVKARYLIGCDGGRSTIRKAIGAQLVGDAELGRTRTTLVRAPKLLSLFGNRRPAWMNWVSNDRVRGNVIAIDGREIWLLHRMVPGRDMPFEALDFDQSIRDLLGVGKEFDYEVLNHEDWTGRRLVADRFRDRCVFIAGDAAHLWVPYAGYGMNAGIADGVNLVWHIGAVLKGFSPSARLAAFEAERHPITEQVSRLAMKNVLENAQAVGGGSVPPALSEPTEAGEALRKAMGARLYELNVPQMAPAGLNFGYYYDRSPLIAYDGEAAPSYSLGAFTSSTAPGCRMPHFWIDGQSVYDVLGDDYTLIRFCSQIDVSPLRGAARDAGMPLSILDAARPNEQAFRHDLLIVRADQHVAWRGNELPADPGGLVALLSGHLISTTS
jgi:2-polyprenyl-6-methoxyphenol hydroxylase-like FAD-dependent oxidoreductase